MSFARFGTFIFTIAALASAISGEAQVTIHVTAPQGACDITTDANGLRLTSGANRRTSRSRFGS
jgi:hypothetical protein